MIKAYYQLTKPGIIYGNAINAIAGFLLASKGHFKLSLFIFVLIGESLVVASACVYNNYIDRDVDTKMSRTKKRSMAVREIPVKKALVYAAVLGTVGFSVLIIHTNWLTTLIGLVGFVDYIVLYSYSKRHSIYGTIVGSISGATPPIAGYCAVTNHFDVAAVILFITFALWQMPHFYAIAMRRFSDYKAAEIPVLPVVKGMYITKINILVYIAAFTISAATLTAFGYTGYPYLVVILILGLTWLGIGIRNFKKLENKMWGRKMFLFSLIVVLLLDVMISLGKA